MRVMVYALAAAGLSWCLIWLRLRWWRGGLDRPNARSLHAVPTPYGGGIGILGAALMLGIVLPVPAGWLLLLAGLGLLSWADDWHPLPFVLRLALHLAAAGAVLWWYAPAPWWAVPVVVLAIAWMTNAYNFMDGANGLAGSMALCGFSAYAIAFALGNDTSYALWCLGIAAAALAFLYFNWDPARIFMGDLGSIPLGFLAGALGWFGYQRGFWPLWFAPTVFAPFLGDASLTLTRRALRGEKVWQAHREHLYQRMVRAGMGHGAMCRRWAVVMAAGAAVAVLLCRLPATAGWCGALLWWCVLAVLGWRVERRIGAACKPACNE